MVNTHKMMVNTIYLSVSQIDFLTSGILGQIIGVVSQSVNPSVTKKRAPIRKRPIQLAPIVTTSVKPYTAADDPQEPYRMQCDLCSKTFKTFHRIQTHYQKKHNMDGYVSCCGDQFFEKDLLVDHILMHVNNRRQMKKITCQHCEQL